VRHEEDLDQVSNRNGAVAPTAAVRMKATEIQLT